MLKTQPLCTIAKLNLREFQMKYKRTALLLCQAKGDTTGSCPEKLHFPIWEDLMSFIAVVQGQSC